MGDDVAHRPPRAGGDRRGELVGGQRAHQVVDALPGVQVDGGDLGGHDAEDGTAGRRRPRREVDGAGIVAIPLGFTVGQAGKTALLALALAIRLRTVGRGTAQV